MTRLFLALAMLVVISVSNVSAQGGGGGGGGGGSGGGGGGGSSGGGGGSSSSGSSSSTTLNMPTLQSATAGLNSIGTQSSTSSSTNILSSTNQFTQFYDSPLYPGRPNSSDTSITTGSGGFGTQTYGSATTSTGGGGRGGSSGSSSTSRTTIKSGNSYTGGSLNNVATQVSYVAVLKFSTPPVPESQKLATLRQSIVNNPQITNSKDISVTIENGVVVLRGRAADDDERRLVENVLRLEPGVNQVKNELVAK